MMHTEDLEHFTNVFIFRTEIVLKATMAIYGVYLSYDLLCISSFVILVCCLFLPHMEYTQLEQILNQRCTSCLQ